MKSLMAAFAAFLFLTSLAIPAQSKVISESNGCVFTNEGRTICRGAIQRATSHVRVTSYGGGVIGGRPAGCPHRFCGCEASRYVFGKIRPELNLAYNWIRKFPRTSPAPGMAAARSGHVMILISHAGGNDWLVHDGNSGGGKTREHVRSIRGYVIVDPNGNQVYSARKHHHRKMASR